MAAENIVHLTKANFDQEVLKSPLPVLVDFWGEYCPPCKMIAPVLDELAGQYAGKLKIGKVNIEESQELASEYRVTAVPTLLFFKNGQITEQIVGFRGPRDLKTRVDAALA
jgi:thioredoxin 1